MTRQNRRQAATKALRARPGQRVAHAIQSAIDGALSAYVALFGLPDLPAEGFDEALKADTDHLAARTAFNKAFKRVYALMPDKTARKRMLALEAAANDLAVKAATVGWKLGITVRGLPVTASRRVASREHTSSTGTKGAVRRGRD